MLPRCSPDGRPARDSAICGPEAAKAAAAATTPGVPGRGRLNTSLSLIFYLRRSGEKRCLLQRRGEQSKERVAVNKSSGERRRRRRAHTHTHTRHQGLIYLKLIAKSLALLPCNDRTVLVGARGGVTSRLFHSCETFLLVGNDDEDKRGCGDAESQGLLTGRFGCKRCVTQIRISFY